LGKFGRRAGAKHAFGAFGYKGVGLIECGRVVVLHVEGAATGNLESFFGKNSECREANYLLQKKHTIESRDRHLGKRIKTDGTLLSLDRAPFPLRSILAAHKGSLRGFSGDPSFLLGHWSSRGFLLPQPLKKAW